MSDITATEIEERNQEYLKGLQGNIGKYLSFLSTMARFHKYEVADLTSFALEAPAMFTAVASKELWAKLFHRKISSTAKGVTLIKDGKKTVYYDVSETESINKKPIPVNLWQYNDTEHKKFINAIVAGESKTERQLKIIAEELANRSSIDDKSKKLLALSIESVILKRMGLSTENATRQLARLSFKDHDITKILEETQSGARIFLDAMQRTLKQQSIEDVTIPENNPLLKEFGVIQVTEKIEQTAELELTSKEEPMQLGLFDTYTATQPNNDNVNADETLNTPNETVEEENTSTTTELADSEPVEEIFAPETASEIVNDTPIDTVTDEQDNLAFEVEKNIESADESGVDETLTALNENVSEENTTIPTESADSEPVEEISVPETASEVVDDTATDEQSNSVFEIEENIESADKSDVGETLTVSTENASEENTSTPNEQADSEPVEEISVPETASEIFDDTATDEQGSSVFEVEKNIESADKSDVSETLTVSTENASEENTSTPTEPTDSEPVEEISAPEMTSEVVDDTPTNEQDNYAYDFDEMDEEEEILPTTIEKQNEVEILPQEDSQAENISSEQSHEENFNPETPTEDVTPDLQTILAEDMAVIRGNSIEKNIFRKNIIAIRTLQQIEREKRPATPEELQALKEYAGFGGIPKAFDKNDPNWNREAWLLQSMLTDKEYNAARASTLNAHYTSGEIVQGIYSGLENLGFNGGTILEPSMGVGGFFGNMPDEMKNYT